MNNIEKEYDNEMIVKHELTKSYKEELMKGNKEASDEFIKDIEEYLTDNAQIKTILLNKKDLINHYYNFIIKYPNEWIVISDLSNPFYKESNDLMFDIIAKFREENYNFERKYNKLRIIK